MGTETRPARPAAWTVATLAALAIGGLPVRSAGQVMDSAPHGLALVDRLEVDPARDGLPVAFDAGGWWGGDSNRIWVRVEGDLEAESGDGDVEVEALYGRLVAPFWDAVIGLRVDRRWEGDPATRAHLAVGLTGLAPHWLEVESTLYVSQDGDVSAQLEAEYDLLLSQRLVLQPRLGLQAAVQAVPEFGAMSGLTDLELGARLRYEVRRELAPYAGLLWHRRLGETASLARDSGLDASRLSFVVGLRAWY